MNSIESDSEDIIVNTVKKSNEKILNDTTKKWVRNCPKCNKEINYNYKCNYTIANNLNSLCKSCVQKDKIPSNKKHFKLTRNCPKCNDIIYYSNGNNAFKAEKSNKKCKKCSGNYRKYSSNSIDWNKNCPICDKVQTYNDYRSFKDAIVLNSRCLKCANKETSNRDYIIKQRRERRLKQHTPQFNFNACKYFDLLNEQKNWNLQHALNGGEIRIIGYSLDAYDKERNIVVEYDEPAHYNNIGQLKQKDVLRQQRIITHLGCKFFRYNEKTKELYEIKTSLTN
jgi:hypothetical protein